MNELLALLFKFQTFRKIIQKIKLPKNFVNLFKLPLEILKGKPLVQEIRKLPGAPRRLLNQAINRVPVLNILSEVWNKLSPDVKSKFGNLDNFNTFLKRFKGEDVPNIPGTSDQDLKKLELDKIDSKNELIKPWNQWVPVISSAVRKTMFIPINRYLKSNDVTGWVKIIFLTNAKIYDYWDVSIKYLDWLRAVNTLGPVDGHGFWSLFLNLTTHRRMGKNNRGYLTKNSIESQYAKTQKLINKTYTNKYKKYSYIKKLPKLRMR